MRLRIANATQGRRLMQACATCVMLALLRWIMYHLAVSSSCCCCNNMNCCWLIRGACLVGTATVPVCCCTVRVQCISLLWASYSELARPEVCHVSIAAIVSAAMSKPH